MFSLAVFIAAAFRRMRLSNRVSPRRKNLDHFKVSINCRNCHRCRVIWKLGAVNGADKFRAWINFFDFIKQHHCYFLLVVANRMQGRVTYFNVPDS